MEDESGIKSIGDNTKYLHVLKPMSLKMIQNLPHVILDMLSLFSAITKSA